MSQRGWRRVAAGGAVVLIVALAIGVIRSLQSDGSSPVATGGPVAALLARSAPASAPFTGLREVHLGVDDRCLRVVVADTLDERVAGLRGKTDLGPYDGMLFVFPAATDAAFTMSGVTDPLDIGFYEADGSLNSSRAMKPCAKAEADCPVYRADGSFLYALETPGGKLPAGTIGNC